MPAPSSSESEKDATIFATEHAPSFSPRRKKNDANGVTMATGLIPWENESIQHVGFVTGKHGRKSQSPEISPGRLRTMYERGRTGELIPLCRFDNEEKRYCTTLKMAAIS